VTDEDRARREELRREAERKRRLAAVFGDALPSTTRDEREDAGRPGPRSGEDPGDRWLKEQVPPHHGG